MQTIQMKSIFSLLVLALIFPFSNAFLDSFGQMFGGMGEQLNGFVDSLYNNVDSWADHIIEHAKGEDCQFTCSHDKIVADNKSYSFVPTGCGPFGIQIKETDLPIKEMRECCDSHQNCYHKCGADKNECDRQFNQCLFKKCTQTQKDPALLKGCRTASKLLLMSFLTFGCKSFKDSQKNACICIQSQEL